MEQVIKVKKTYFGFSFDPSVLNDFKKYCKGNQLNMSAVVQNFMKNYITEKKEGDWD